MECLPVNLNISLQCIFFKNEGLSTHLVQIPFIVTFANLLEKHVILRLYLVELIYNTLKSGIMVFSISTEQSGDLICMISFGKNVMLSDLSFPPICQLSQGLTGRMLDWPMTGQKSYNH